MQYHINNAIYVFTNTFTVTYILIHYHIYKIPLSLTPLYTHVLIFSALTSYSFSYIYILFYLVTLSSLLKLCLIHVILGKCA